MKKLYLVRHAKSSWSDWNLQDHERPLNARGRRDAPFMALKAHDLCENVDLLISSHAVRANTTAIEFDKILNPEASKLVIDQNLYHASEEDIWKVIYGLDESCESVMLFGHNPGMTYFSNLFGAEYLDNVPTCGMFYLESKAKVWNRIDAMNTERKWFIYPKMYQK